MSQDVTTKGHTVGAVLVFATLETTAGCGCMEWRF